MIYLLIAVIVINFLAFVAIGADKKQSIRNGERIRELSLFLWAICFGSAGVLLGMLAFRHKTQKLKFIFGITVLLLQQIAIMISITNWGML